MRESRSPSRASKPPHQMQVHNWQVRAKSFQTISQFAMGPDVEVRLANTCDSPHAGGILQRKIDERNCRGAIFTGNGTLINCSSSCKTVIRPTLWKCRRQDFCGTFGTPSIPTAPGNSDTIDSSMGLYFGQDISIFRESNHINERDILRRLIEFTEQRGLMRVSGQLLRIIRRTQCIGVAGHGRLHRRDLIFCFDDPLPTLISCLYVRNRWLSF
jgi:hypothetical protein